MGFVTVAAATVDADDLADGRRMPPYPLPVLRVARLAVSETDRGRGLGKALLRHAIEIAEQLRDTVGCVGLVVDVKPGAEGFYRAFGIVEVLAEEGGAAGVPRSTLGFLPLGAVPRRR